MEVTTPPMAPHPLRTRSSRQYSGVIGDLPEAIRKLSMLGHTPEIQASDHSRIGLT